MNALVYFIIKHEVTTPMVFFLMLFAMGMAIFHTVIFAGLYDLKFKKWLFFVINPALIGLSALIDKKLTLMVFFFLAVSIFLFTIVGVIRTAIVSSRISRKEKEKFNKKYNIKPTPLWKKIARGALVLSFFGLFGLIGPYAFLFIFIVIPVIIALFPGNKGRYLRYQRTLPTSKIRSVAMGLAEIEGRLRMTEPVIAPIKKKECIGFEYKIEDIKKDKDGKESYSTIFSETICNPFFVEDETGSIEVNPEKIEFVWVDEDEQYRRGGKRYTQYLLNPGDKMLLIGRAGLKENNQPVFEYEEIRKVFAISPSEKITHYNTYKPLLNSFIGFTCIFAFIAALILITPIRIKGDRIIMEKPVFSYRSKDIEDRKTLQNGAPNYSQDRNEHGDGIPQKDKETQETGYERNDMILNTFAEPDND